MILRLTGLLGIAALFNTLFNTFFVAGILSVSETTSAPPKNSPPVVEILAPKNNSVHPINTLIRYAVSVADKEDGESRFDEIPRDQIFLKIRFVEGYPGRPTGLEARNLPEAAGLSQLKKSDCFSCHHFRDKLIGPSFAEIASRYAQTPDPEKHLAGKIIRGSKGVWGEVIMPGHSDLSEKAAAEIGQWILKDGSNTGLDYVIGKEGTFRAQAPDKKQGYFELTATYTDNGLPGQPGAALTGEDRVIIQCQ